MKCKCYLITKAVLTSKLSVLIINVVLCITAFVLLPKYYNLTLEMSDICVPVSAKNIPVKGDLPLWFTYNNDTIHTCRELHEEDVRLLYTYVEQSDSLYYTYCQDISELAYKSNACAPNTKPLLILTLCFAILGCCARSLYDYIGWECFKKGQDMKKWWPWYIFRLIICIPIVSFLLVSARSAAFSTFFTARDLNTYIAVAFLAGFSMVEFLTMLRRISKSLFAEGASESKDATTSSNTNETK